MKAIFRVDASVQMGSGHFMRCLTLAETLRERGVDTRFVTREHLGHLVGLLI
jgi:UDP-2,4-diacetamido-2,4,6-trideoxy-beta-L-altropyranose hydrolase